MRWSCGRLAIMVLLAGLVTTMAQGKPASPNVLIFTVDDMDFTSLNVNGCPVPGLTPNMDRLSREGLQFLNAHLNSAVCQPSRQSMMTGLHTHRNGTLGFTPVPPGIPNLSRLLMDQGWFTASFNKGRDYVSFEWSLFIDGYGGRGFGRDGALLAADTRDAIQRARKAGKRFLINVPTSDPHRVFAGSADEKVKVAKVAKQYPEAAAQGKVYMPPFREVCRPEQAWIPPYLPDLPEIRREWAQYYNTVHRADETLGRILAVLDEEGVAADTLVIFFSDNGASFPTSKQNCYPHSTRTPLIFRWPGVIKPGGVDHAHMVSTMDIMPTVLEVAGAPLPEKLDGRSLLSLLKGGTQTGRDHAFTTFNYISPWWEVFPMRAVHTRRFTYIFNAWSDGKTRFQGECHGGLTFAAMRAAAQTNPALAARVRHIEYRTPEELYDVEKDPGCLRNLANHPEYASVKRKMKEMLEEDMRRTQDPLLACFLGKGPIPPELIKARPPAKQGGDA